MALDVREFTVEARGGRLGVCRLGSAPNAQAVVAVHGITGNNRTWQPVARNLGDAATVVAPDLRGRGSSRELPGPVGLAAHGEDLLALLDALELAQVVLVGHSLGAYIVSAFAVAHPDRVSRLVLIDGGLPVPGVENVDPQEFVDAFLGPAVARLKMRFPTRQAYLDWWHEHPAIGDSDIAEADLEAYVDHDTVGQEPELRSSVTEGSVRGDAAEIPTHGRAAFELDKPAVLLTAPRGLQNNPQPMQPRAAAEAWAAQAPELRRTELVADTNHYTIVLGAHGAAAVAAAVRDAVNT